MLYPHVVAESLELVDELSGAVFGCCAGPPNWPMSTPISALSSSADRLFTPGIVSSTSSSTPTAGSTSRSPSPAADRPDLPRPRGLHYVDGGTSGGVRGLDRGYCLMIGGEDPTVKHLDPIFESLAPGTGSIDRTPGREGEPSTSEQGSAVRPVGRGAFREDGAQRYRVRRDGRHAEGLNIIRNANVGKAEHEVDAETTPLRHPGHYQYDINVAEVAEVWPRGSVIASWLLDLTAPATFGDPDLKEFSGRVSDSGEGR